MEMIANYAMTQAAIKESVGEPSPYDAGKVDLDTRAKKANLDAIHDTVHEMARDEARHGKAFAGLLKRYFGE